MFKLILRINEQFEAIGECFAEIALWGFILGEEGQGQLSYLTDGDRRMVFDRWLRLVE